MTPGNERQHTEYILIGMGNVYPIASLSGTERL